MHNEAKRILFHDNSRNGIVGGSHHSLLLLVKNLDPARYEKLVMLNSDIALRPEFEKHCRVIVWTGPSASYFAGLGQREGWHTKFSSCPAFLANPLNFCYRKTLSFYSDYIRGSLLVRRYSLFLKREQIDLLHLNNSFDPYWNLAAKLAGVPVIQHVRGIPGTIYPPLCYLSTKIICISDDIKKKILSRGFNPKKVVRIYNAVDSRSFRPTRDPEELRAELGIGRSDPVVALFGNIQRWKGQDTLLNAGIRLRQKYRDIRCVLFGEVIQQDYAEELRQVTAAKEMGGAFIFAGYKYDIADWMNCADIIVHASTSPEPFGRVLIEAMSLGKPVIGTNLGAVPEIIENRVSGLLFEPGDDKQLAGLVDSLLAHPEERNRLGRNAIQRVRQHFDVQQQLIAIDNVYQSIFNHRQR